MNELQWPHELEQLEKALLLAGFRVVLSDLSLGNAVVEPFSVVELSSPRLCVRLQREGPDWRVGLRYPRSEWRDLTWWQRQLLHGQGSELVTIGQQAAYLEDHLADLMGYEDELDELPTSDPTKQRASYLADVAGVARPAWAAEIVARPRKSADSDAEQTEKIPLPSDLERLLPVLQQAGFRVVREEKSGAFANALIELAGPDWNVRFVRDRDYWDIEVRRPRSEWRGMLWWQRTVVHDDGPDLKGLHAETVFVEHHLAKLRGDRAIRETVDDPAARARRNASSLGSPPPSWAIEPGGRQPSMPWRIRLAKFLPRLSDGRR